MNELKFRNRFLESDEFQMS